MTSRETIRGSWTKGIGFKTAIAMSIGLFVVISVFSHANVLVTERKLLNNMQTEATKMSETILSSLENSMISNDRQIIQAVVDAVGRESTVEDIKIIDIKGRIMWPKKKSETGLSLDKTKVRSCLGCHATATPIKNSLTTILQNEDGTNVLSSTTLIYNKPKCYTCHDPKQKVLGKLLVDFSTKNLDKMVGDNRRMLILSAVATILSSIVLSFITLAILVRKPLARLLVSMDEVEQGRRNTMEEAGGEDEVSLLNRKFNSMIAAIDKYEQKMVSEYINERMTLSNVCEVLSRSGSIEETTRHIIDTINIGFGVQKCAIMLFNDSGDIQVQGTEGLSDDETDLLRNYMEVVLSINSAYSLHETGMEQIKEMTRRGEIFLARGTANIVDDFLVVPLKAANTLRGAIIVCKVNGMELKSDKLKELFSIVATAVAPHFHLSLSMDERRRMAISPFSVFVETIRTSINRAEEYQMALSLVMIKVDDFKEVCLRSGCEVATLSVQNLGASLSSAIEKMHIITRISEDRIALILPMTDKAEATELIENVVAKEGDDLAIAFRIGTYPEDGNKPEDLICACSW